MLKSAFFLLLLPFLTTQKTKKKKAPFFDPWFQTDGLTYTSFGTTNFNKIGKGTINYSLKGKDQKGCLSAKKDTVIRVKSMGSDIHNAHSKDNHLSLEYEEKTELKRKKKSNPDSSSGYSEDDEYDFGFF